jgi:hypothetical protein
MNISTVALFRAGASFTQGASFAQVWVRGLKKKRFSFS